MNEELTTVEENNQGQNIKIGRIVKNVNQSELADRLNMHQSELSRLESLKVVPDDMLKNVALALDISYSFLKDYNADNAAKVFNISDTTVNSAQDSQDAVNFGNGTVNETINHFPIEQVMQIHKEILQMQKEHNDHTSELLNTISDYKVEIALLKKENGDLKKKK